MKSEIDDLKKLQQSTTMHLDELEQYGRRENLEIHGVPTMRNESTNQIVKTVANNLNVQLDERHISTSHRLKQNEEDTRQHSPIIGNLQIEINAMKYSENEKCFKPTNSPGNPLIQRLEMPT